MELLLLPPFSFLKNETKVFLTFVPRLSFTICSIIFLNKLQTNNKVNGQIMKNDYKWVEI
ncbi:hypothetical protein LIU_06105 [Enterococcus durans]|nr:hypothetical protein LIU_06105 [Enterococcus durans]